MTLTHKDDLDLGGTALLRAWRKGVLPMLMDKGMNLRDSMRLARLTGFLVYESEAHNLVVATGKALVAKAMVDQDLGITYHAMGVGTTAPGTGDVKLVDEVRRNAWTLRTPSGSTITFDVFYTAALSTFYIKECGAFGGASASATKDSGSLFSRWLQSYDNSSGSNDLTFQYVISIP
jgi:hypothetical protein